MSVNYGAKRIARAMVEYPYATYVRVQNVKK